MEPPASARAGSLALAACCAIAFAWYSVRDLPRQLVAVRGDLQRFAGLAVPACRIEMAKPAPGEAGGTERLDVAQRYFGMIERLLRETPPGARIGLLELPSDQLYRFARYFLYPRHAFRIDERPRPLIEERLRLDFVLPFPRREGDWRLERVR